MTEVTFYRYFRGFVVTLKQKNTSHIYLKSIREMIKSIKSKKESCTLSSLQWLFFIAMFWHKTFIRPNSFLPLKGWNRVFTPVKNPSILICPANHSLDISVLLILNFNYLIIDLQRRGFYLHPVDYLMSWQQVVGLSCALFFYFLNVQRMKSLWLNYIRWSACSYMTKFQVGTISREAY